jgi:DeoR/GlpR family transcriptional regulator of sugar metabolism
MPRRLYRQERHEIILKRIQQTGYVSVSELRGDLGVSSVTVRNDLDALESEGHLVRTHGGAVPAHLGEEMLSFSARQRDQVEAKERIGAVAARLVADGEAIVLDASTTAWHMARHLLALRELTVLTTGLYVALELLRAPGISVMLPGGRIWREAAAVVGGEDHVLPGQGNLRRAFFGGRGFSLEQGLTDPNQDEVALKRRLISAVPEINVIVDASKIGKVAFATCASLSEIHRVVTDQDAPPEFVAALRDRGIEVLLA